MLGCWLPGIGNGKEKSSPRSRSSVLRYGLVWVWVNESKCLNWQVLTSSFLLEHSQTRMPHAQTKPLPCERLCYSSLWNSDVQNHFLQVPWCTAARYSDEGSEGIRCSLLWTGKNLILKSQIRWLSRGCLCPFLFGGTLLSLCCHDSLNSLNQSMLSRRRFNYTAVAGQWWNFCLTGRDGSISGAV